MKNESKTVRVALSPCDKKGCMYWQETSIDLGKTIVTGTLVQRHCVLCAHVKKYDFYTRIKVGE